MITEADRIKHIREYYFSKKLKAINQLEKEGNSIINLGIGNPDLKPPETVNIALNQSFSYDKNHCYQSYSGMPELRQAIHSFYQKHYKISLNPSKEILPLMGSKEGIMHISMSFLNPGDLVLSPNPGYPAYAACAKIAGGQTIHYNVTSTISILEQLHQLSQQQLDSIKLMWINFPHMPTGETSSLEEYNQLAAFCKEYNILLCNDNPYDFILNDTPLSILNNTTQQSHVLELFSLSKSFNMAGYRVGAVLGNEKLIQSILKFKSNMDSGMFRGIQLAAIEALKQDQNWFERINQIYSKRKEIGLKIFTHLKCSFNPHTAGFFIWAKVPNENADFWSELILEKAKVFITPGHIFGSNGDSYLRLSLCSSEEILYEALARIKEAI